jgi:hypothetical protein
MVWYTFFGLPTIEHIILELTPQQEEKLKPTPTYIYSGALQIDFPEYWSYDNSKISAAAALPDVYIYHADKSKLFGSDTGANGNVSGELYPSDAGILYMVLDYGTQTTYYLDVGEITGSWLKADSLTMWDHDKDGTDEYCWTLDFTSLGALQAGESKKEKTLNLYVLKYDSDPTLTSTVNCTGVSTSTYSDFTAELYISGWSGEGYAIKITRVLITLPDSNNATYVEDGKVQFKQMSLGYGYDKRYTWSSASWDLANKQWTVNIGVTDWTEEAYAKLIKYERNAGTTFATAKITMTCGKFASSAVVLPTLKIYYIDPAGTSTSFTHAFSFTQS